MIPFNLCKIKKLCYKLLMENTANQKAANKWLSVPIIATITRLLCRELTLQNEYLLHENKILKSKIKKRIIFTDDERRILVEAAMAMGKDLMKKVVNIVQPKTILSWQRRLENQKWDYSDRRKNNPGRPSISVDIEQIVCRMARENEAVFLCADMFQKEVWTFRGLVTAFVFFVIHLQTRKVILSRATFSPTNQWLKQQVRHVLWECENQGIEPRFFLRDNDMLYPDEMDAILKSSGVDTVKTPFGAPNANAHAERYVLNCKRDCLNHLLVFGLNRLQNILDCYTSYFNEHRPHQGIGNRIPAKYHMPAKRQSGNMPLNVKTRNVVRKDFLGGLLKSYKRVA